MDMGIYTSVDSGQGGRRAGGGGGSRKLCEWREEEEWRPVGTIHNSTVVDTTSSPPTNCPTQLVQYSLNTTFSNSSAFISKPIYLP